jgi:hypothetical protein
VTGVGPPDLEMTIADRLASARHARFVGRRGELALFDTALLASEAPFAVLFVHGPGGVGKTALLHAFTDRARAAGAHALLIDGRDIEPSPSGFRSRCDALLQREEARPVLLVDTYEMLDLVDPWLRHTLVPQLPADAIVVIASRKPPSKGWRGDPGWTDLMQVVPLANLPAEDARSYLETSGVVDSRYDEIVDITQGHPLALSLVVDVLAHRAEGTDLAPFHTPDVVRLLLEHFVEDLPTPDHRVALDTCALVRATTHRHLRATVGHNYVDGLFEWLRGLSFVREGPRGLFPHDLARDVLAADVRWRDPGRYRALMLTVLRIAGDEMRQAPVGAPPRQAVLDLLFTFRAHTKLNRYWNFNRLGEIRPEPVKSADRETVIRMVRDSDGPANAELAAFWFDRQPGAFRVNRDHRGAIETLVCWLSLTDARSSDVAADPAARAVLAYVADHHPPAASELVTVGRFACPTNELTQRQMLAALGVYECLRRAVSHPELTWDVLVVRHPEFWAPLLSNFGYERLVGSDVDIDEHPYALFAHDWRIIPGAFALVLEDRDWRRIRARLTPSTVELSRPEFEAAVRQALRDIHRPAALARNPLAGTALVKGAEPEAAGPVLAKVLADAAQTLTTYPRDEKLYRALDRTYFHPAPTQERAAELLGLPSSTYRRHLARGVARMITSLWDQHHGASQIGAQ